VYTPTQYKHKQNNKLQLDHPHALRVWLTLGATTEFPMIDS
jgi:hypothetical protein